MALPQTLDATIPPNTESPRLGAQRIRAIEQFIADVFGVPTSPTQITAAAAAIIAAGGIVPRLGAYALSALPAAGTPGRLAIVSDDANRVYEDNGTAWVPLGGGPAGGGSVVFAASVALAAGTAHVTLSGMPNAGYKILLSVSANETVRWSNKAQAGFDITSSNGASTATVDYVIVLP